MAGGRTRWAGAVSALVLIASCGTEPADGRSAGILEEQVRTVLLDQGAGAPAALAPVAMPDGWRYESAGGSSGSETPHLTLDFVKTGSDRSPRPAVSICIVASDDLSSCQAGGGLARIEIATAPASHSAVLVGSTDALDEWAGVEWTTDLDALPW